MKIWKSVFGVTEVVNFEINAAQYLKQLKAMADAHVKYNNILDKQVKQTVTTVDGKITDFIANIQKEISATKTLTQTLQINAKGQTVVKSAMVDTTAEMVRQEREARKLQAALVAGQSATRAGVRSAFPTTSGVRATPEELNAFRAQEQAVVRIANAMNLTTTQTKAYFDLVRNGTIKVTDENTKLVAAIQKLDAAYLKLGQTDAKRTQEAIANAEREKQARIKAVNDMVAAEQRRENAVRRIQSALLSAYDRQVAAAKKVADAEEKEQRRRDGVRAKQQAHLEALGRANVKLMTAIYGTAEANKRAGEATRRGFIQSAIARTAQAKATEEAKKQTEALTISWQSFVRLVTVQLIHRSISAIVVAMRNGIVAAKELSIKIAEIQTISQRAQLSFGGWAEGLVKLSSSFGFSVLDSAEAAYQALSNQIAQGAEALKFVESASRLAVAAVSDQNTAVLALTGVLNAYSLDASYADQVSAALFKTIELGRVRLDEMAQSIGDVAVLASQLNIGFEELFATIATITIQGVKYNKAATQIRGFLTKLIKPTEEMTKLLSELGVATGEDAIATYGLAGIYEELRKKTQGSSTELAKFFPLIRGITGAMIATGSGFETYKKNLEAVQNAQESFDRAVTTVLENQGKKVAITVETLKNFFLVEIGQNFIASLAALQDKTGAVLETFRIAMRGIKVIVATVLLGFVMKALNAVANRLLTLKIAADASALGFTNLGNAMRASAAVNPYIAAYVTLQLLVELTTYFWNKHNEAVAKARDDFEEFWDTYTEQSIQALNKTADFIVEAFNVLARESLQAGARISGFINKYAAETVTFLEAMSKAIKANAKKDIDVIKEELKLLEDAFKKTQDELKTVEDRIKDLVKESTRIKFDLKIEGLEDPKAKLDIIKNRLREIGAELNTTRDVERVNDLYEEGNRLLKLRDDIIKESNKLNEEGAKRFKEISQEIKDEAEAAEKDRIKAAKKRADIEKELTKPGGTADRSKIDLIKDEIKLIIESQNERIAKIKTLQEEQAAIKKVYSEQNNLAKEYDALVTRTKNTLEEIKRIKAETLKAEAEAVEKKKQEQAAYEAALDAYIEAEKNIPKLATETNLDVINSIEKQALDAIDSLLAAKRKVYGTDLKDVIALQQLRERVEAQTSARIDQLKIEAARAEVERNKEVLKQNIEGVKENNKVVVERLKDLTAAYYAKTGKFLEGVSEEIKAAAQNLPAEELARLRENTQNFPLEEYKRYIEAYQTQIQQLKNLQAELQKAGVAADILEAKGKTFDQQLNDLTASVTGTSSAADKLRDSMANLKRIIDEIKPPTPTPPPKPGEPLPESKGGFITRALGGAIQTFAKGNRVQVGTDTIPALLSPGEFVMNKGATRKFYSQLVAMNSGVSRFAEGGGTNNTFGDFNISMQSSGNESVDVIKLGRLLRREIRRGTVTLTR